jgi:hypothetical protein
MIEAGSERAAPVLVAAVAGERHQDGPGEARILAHLRATS